MAIRLLIVTGREINDDVAFISENSRSHLFVLAKLTVAQRRQSPARVACGLRVARYERTNSVECGARLRSGSVIIRNEDIKISESSVRWPARRHLWRRVSFHGVSVREPRTLGALTILVHVLDHLDVGHGDQTFGHHLIQIWKQLLNLLL